MDGWYSFHFSDCHYCQKKIIMLAVVVVNVIDTF